MDRFMIILCSLPLANAAVTISTPPSHVTTRVGEDATLTCRVTGGEPDDINTLTWREFITVSTGNLIYKSNVGIMPGYESHYEVVGTGGNYDLVVKYPELNDGGYYGCGLDLEGGAPHRGDLAVLGKPDIQHSELIEGKYNFVRCEAQYGATSPDQITEGQRAQLRMYIEYESGDAIQEGNLTEVTKGSPGPGDEYQPWHLRMDLNQTFTGDDHGENLTCEIYTVAPEMTHEATRVLDILYSVRNLAITPRKTYYYVGEFINCTAEGNPEPNIKWEPISSAGPRPVDSGYLEISYLMEGYNKWRCDAVNTAEETTILSEEFEFEVVSGLTISTPPSDETTRVGENATLICRVTGGEPDNMNTLTWREHITASTGNLIYKSNVGIIPGYESDYEIVGTYGNYDLIVKDPQLNDGGRYGCGLDLEGGAPHQGDLAVLGKPDIQLPQLIENKDSFIRCEALYGAPSPDQIAEGQRAKLRMYIEYDAGDGIQEGDMTEVTLGSPGPGEEYQPWHLRMDLNRTFDLGDHGVNLTCEIYTEAHALIHKTTQLLDIIYSVRNLEIAPRKTYYYVGEFINCTAKGNPEPYIDWEPIQTAGPRPVVSGYLEISYLMEGYNKWRCDAVNTAEETTTLSEEFEFEVVPMPTASSGRHGRNDPSRKIKPHLSLV